MMNVNVEVEDSAGQGQPALSTKKPGRSYRSKNLTEEEIETVL